MKNLASPTVSNTIYVMILESGLLFKETLYTAGSIST